MSNETKKPGADELNEGFKRWNKTVRQDLDQASDNLLRCAFAAGAAWRTARFVEEAQAKRVAAGKLRVIQPAVEPGYAEFRRRARAAVDLVEDLERRGELEP